MLQGVPSETFVGLGGVIFGSLLTTFGVWLTNRANLRQVRLQLEHEERAFRQRQTKERLEELYLLVCRWQHGLFSNFLNLTLVMKGEADYNWYLDQMKELSSTVDFNRLEMIIGIYGPELKSVYDAAISARSAINEVATQHKRAYMRGEAGQSFLKPYTAAELKLEEACEALKLAVAAAARGV